VSENARSRPPRVYVPDLAEQRAESEENPKKEILLRKEERDHVRSRRLRDGDEVVALDGKGARTAARVVRGGTAIALLPSKKISSSSSSLSSPPRPALPGEPASRVTVALACAEPARIEWAVEKGTECGAAGFALLACERSQKAHVAALSSPARLERLRRIAVEATKQCDRTIVPFVEGPKKTGDFLRGLRGETLLIADPDARVEDGPVPSRRTRVLSERSEFTREGEGAPAGRDRQSAGPGPLLGAEATVLAIGPEGGFTPAEILLFEEKGAIRTSLGERTLRLETAVVVALARLVDPA
jgi:16S rRNA (uracil1498-N3)-methyltransferase